MVRSTIGAVARRAGVGVETVRFYQRRGLIEQPPEPDHGFREYPEEVVNRIRFIRHAKDLGFTLQEIGVLLSLKAHPRENCTVVRHRAEEKLTAVESKIDALRKIRRELRRLVTACDKREATEECPILAALE